MDFDQLHDEGRLYSKPETSIHLTGSAPPEGQSMKLTQFDADGLLLAPTDRGPVPVLVMLHGAGGKAEDSVALVVTDQKPILDEDRKALHWTVRRDPYALVAVTFVRDIYPNEFFKG